MVAGAALGYVIGKTITRRRAEREAARGSSGEDQVQMYVAPMLSLDGKTAGVQMMVSF